ALKDSDVDDFRSAFFILASNLLHEISDRRSSMRLIRVWLSAACVASALALGVSTVDVAAAQRKPKNATAQCVDGTYSTAKSQQGACSNHGGVKTWYGGTETKAEAKVAKTETKAATKETRTEGTAGRKVARTEEKADRKID